MAMDNTELPLLEHLAELRRRLFAAIIALLIGAAGGLLITPQVIRWLVRPLQGGQVIVLSPTEAPIIYFKVALLLGFVLAMPYILYQVYAFLAPGLKPNERRVFLLGIPAAIVLFLLGAAFTLQVLVPLSMPVLMSFLAGIVSPNYSLEEYISFLTTLLFWMGLLFQTPLVIYFMARMGWITPNRLSGLRKIIIFVAALIAAAITPTTDPVTMLLVTGPFVVLYEAGILLARLAVRQRRATG